MAFGLFLGSGESKGSRISELESKVRDLEAVVYAVRDHLGIIQHPITLAWISKDSKAGQGVMALYKSMQQAR
jgi:hypothetical protein